MSGSAETSGPAGPSLRLAVPRERQPGERRVALVPTALRPLLAAGMAIAVETGAGEQAGYHDAAYAGAGAPVAAGLADLLKDAGVILHVTLPGDDEIGQMPRGATLVGLFRAAAHRPAMERLAKRGVDVHSLESCPGSAAPRTWTCSPRWPPPPATTRC